MTLLWLLLPIMLGLVFAEMRSRRYLLKLLPDCSQVGYPALLRQLPDLLALFALALILLTLQPTRPTAPGRQSGPAVAMVVDVSTSMQVTDQQPDRLTRAKHEILTLIDNLPDARFSLVPFAGTAVLQVPLTGDRAGLRFFINNLHPGMIAAPGSAPEEAVLLAEKSLNNAKGERLIILITDGERTIAEPPPLLSDSIPVYSILTGTTAGGLVGTDKTAISRADPERLAVIARRTGGGLLNGNLLTPAILTLPLVKSLARTAAQPTTDIAIVVTLILLLLRSVPAVLSIGRLFSISLLLLTLFVPGCKNNGTSPQPRTQFEDGLQAAQNNDNASALAAFATAAKRLDGKQRSAALYNQGTLLLKAGQIDAAITLLEQALLLLPGDTAIRDNLLLALVQQDAHAATGESRPKHQASGEGKELSPKQAQRLLDSVRLDPAAPITEATPRLPTVLKEW